MFKNLTGSYLAKPFIFMVADNLVVVPDRSVTGIDCVMKVNDPVFQRNYHRHQLEGGAGLCAFADGVIVSLVIEPVRTYLEVGYCLDVTGLHLHHHRATVMGFVFRELLIQCVLCCILKVKVDCSDDVISRAGVNRLEVIDIDPGSSRQALLHLKPVLPGEVIIE